MLLETGGSSSEAVHHSYSRTGDSWFNMVESHTGWSKASAFKSGY